MNGLEISGLCLAVLVGAPAARFVVHEVRHWKHAKHVIRVTEEEDGLDFYGSLSLADEVAWKRRELAHDLGVMFLPVPSTDPVPWLELAADERLEAGDEWDDATLASLRDDSDECVAEGNEAFARMMLDGQRAYEQEHRDSGPGGVSSLTPGPDWLPIREDAQGRDVRVCATDSRPAARADLTGSLSSRPSQEDPGSLAHGESGLPPERLCGPEQPHEKPAGTESAGSGHPGQYPLPQWDLGQPPAGTSFVLGAPWGPIAERLADTGDIRDAALLADATTYMRDQDAAVADWLAGRAIAWARLEIGAFT